jgi:hypothetical protein
MSRKDHKLDEYGTAPAQKAVKKSSIDLSDTEFKEIQKTKAQVG